MEILILAMIFSVVVKRGVEDVWHTARGGTPPRLAAAKARRKSGAAGRYWGQVWGDVWTDKAAKRAARRSGATPDRTPKPRGAATRYFAGLLQDGRRAAGRSWEDGWSRLDEKRRTKASRPRPGQVTVPGTVVPNAEDGDGDRPQDRPEDEPSSVPDEDGDETDWTVPQNASRPCPKCGRTLMPVPGTMHLDEGDGGAMIDLECDGNCGLKSTHYWAPTDAEYEEYFGHAFGAEDDDDPDSGPESTPDYDPSPATPTTTEGLTMTTIPTGEVVGLSDTIKFCEGSSEAFRGQVHATELAIASITAGGVTGPGAAKLSHAMELCAAAAAAMDEAAVEFKSHTGIQEQYDANPGAGTREFVTAGR